MEERDDIPRTVAEDVPLYMRTSDVLDFLQHKDVDWRYVDALKTTSSFTDETLSDWLNVSVKTFRSYRQPDNLIKPNIKEHVLLLVALLNHGKNTFGSIDLFQKWVETPNFFFDNQAPTVLLNTVSGIQFVSDRLTAIEFGDNV